MGYPPYLCAGHDRHTPYTYARLEGGEIIYDPWQEREASILRGNAGGAGMSAPGCGFNRSTQQIG